MSISRDALWSLAVLVAMSLTGSLVAYPDEQPSQKKAPPKEPELPPSPPSLLDEKIAPIDLPSALRLAGVQNPEILLARERVVESDAARQLAAAQFLPSINVGTNLDLHTGPVQRSTGVIQKVNRGSLYLGLGANAVGAGTVNVPGVVWNVNLSGVVYDWLVSRQVVQQQAFASEAVRNDVLLRVASAYLELLRAEGRRAVSLQTRDETHEVARIIAGQVAGGKERQAEADRSATELDQRNADVLQAEGDVLTASARLCQLLNLDPSIRLHATDGWVVPAPIVPDPIPVPELMAIALTQRPELKERQAAIRAALLYLQGARVLPFSPNVIVGFSAGSFGGGSNVATDTLGQPRFGSFAGRDDFDAVVYWTARNLGIGNLAQIRLGESNVRSSNLRQLEVLDRVRAEVASAYARVHVRYAQIGTGERAVRSAQKAFKEDLPRTIQNVGPPLEVLDSLRLLGRSRAAYLDAIIDYNRAQFELYVAIGQPPADTLARPIPETLVPAPALSAHPTKP